MYTLILASASPRRKEILEQVGLPFIIEACMKEEIITSSSPKEVVLDLSMQKAEAVAIDKKGPCIVLGADTVVAVDGKILGKPKTKEEAADMLKLLSGKEHQVYTGVCILVISENGERRKDSFAVISNVFVASLSNEEIWSYISTGEPMDKAGAYAVQGRFAPFIQRIEGDYYNIVGLPIAQVYQKFKELGIHDSNLK